MAIERNGKINYIPLSEGGVKWRRQCRRNFMEMLNGTKAILKEANVIMVLKKIVFRSSVDFKQLIQLHESKGTHHFFLVVYVFGLPRKPYVVFFSWHFSNEVFVNP